MAGRGGAAAREGRAWQGRRREGAAKDLRWRPRRRRGGGGGGCGRHGATRNSFKPAPGDDAAARRPPAEPPGDCGEEARRGLRVERRGRRERRGAGGPCAAQVRACALRPACAHRARAPPRPAGPQREWGRPGVPTAASSKSSTSISEWRGGASCGFILSTKGARRKALPRPSTWSSY